jgi:hypothetical protein
MLTSLDDHPTAPTAAWHDERALERAVVGQPVDERSLDDAATIASEAHRIVRHRIARTPRCASSCACVACADPGWSG